jgi:hypothetical protein
MTRYVKHILMGVVFVFSGLSVGAQEKDILVVGAFSQQMLDHWRWLTEKGY